MNDITTLALPAHTLCRLLQYCNAHPGGPSAGELTAVAIEEWLARGHAHKPPAIRARGYQWKSVFLPEGTQLRAWNRIGYAYAEVIGDAIIYRGEPVSPHAFICRCKGISRSAWAEVALLFPHEDRWRRADALRRDLARREVLQADTAPETQQQPARSAAGFSTVLPPAGASRLPRVLPMQPAARREPRPPPLSK